MAEASKIKINGTTYNLSAPDSSVLTVKEGGMIGTVSVNTKGNVAVESLTKHVNLEAAGSIQMKPTNQIIVDTGRRMEQAIAEGKDPADNNECVFEVKYDDISKDNPPLDDEPHGYLKLKARAIDLRCHEHGGIALQIAGSDSDKHENKIKFESDRKVDISLGNPQTSSQRSTYYTGEGGKGLEFGTFNNLHTSLYTGDYRFKADASVFPATRGEIEQVSTGKYDYPTQADDFKDKIVNSNSATWSEIVNVARKYADGEIRPAMDDYYTKEETDDRIAIAVTEASDIVVADDLNTDSSAKALSARQGKALREMVEDLGGAHNAYDSIEKIAPYLYSLNYSNLDYDYAYEYYRTHFIDIDGGCSAVRNGNFYGRNYDWTYDNTAAFVIRTPHEKNRAASIAICAGIPELSDSFVESRGYSELYKALPFRTLDGINEYGVFCNDNVVPKGEAGEGIPTTGTNPDSSVSICMLMLPRYILDHYKSAAEAVADIPNLNVYAPESESFAHYEIHTLLGDANSTYIIEYVNNEVVIVDFSDSSKAYYNRPYMTNFFISLLHDLNEDGTITRNTDSSVNQCGVTKYGAGLERYNILAQNYAEGSTHDGMVSLMKKVRYTNAYKDETLPRWNSESVGDYTAAGYKDITITSPDSDFDLPYSISQEWFLNRSRTDGSTWQTVTCSVYDIQNKVLTLISQEDNVERKFNFDEYYTAAEVDAKFASGEMVEYIDEVKDNIFFSKNEDGTKKNLKLDVKDLTSAKIAVEAVKDIELTTENNIVVTADKVKLVDPVDETASAMVEAVGGISMGETPRVSFLTTKISAKAKLTDVAPTLGISYLNNFAGTVYYDNTVGKLHVPMEFTVFYTDTTATNLYKPTATSSKTTVYYADGTQPNDGEVHFVQNVDLGEVFIVEINSSKQAKKEPKPYSTSEGYENVILEPISYVPEEWFVVLPPMQETVIDTVPVADIIELAKHKDALLALLQNN